MGEEKKKETKGLVSCKWLNWKINGCSSLVLCTMASSINYAAMAVE